MARAGLLSRTRVLASMLHLGEFSLAELAAAALLPVGTVVGVINTLPDDSLYVVNKTELDEPIRYDLTQDAFFRVQVDVAELTDAPELLPFPVGRRE